MLQAFALCEAINAKYNVECELIDYRFAEKTIIDKKTLFKIRLKRISYYLFNINKVLIQLLYRNRLSRRKLFFDNFAKAIPHSHNRYEYEDELYLNPPEYDIYITGSDQTWSPKIGLFGVLFLDFVKNRACKAAYAPSIGVSSLQEMESDYISTMLKGYDYISCREKIGANILQGLTSKPVINVLDPTFLINNEKWAAISKRPDGAPEESYILCYFLGDRSYCRKYVNELSKQRGISVYYVPVSYADCKRRNNLLYDVGPKEFLYLINNAEIVCTDSFHGMALSINMNKNFYGFVKHKGEISGGDNSRIYDLLKRFGLENRLVYETESRPEISDSIDYAKVNSLIKTELEVSYSFIDGIIGNV